MNSVPPDLFLCAFLLICLFLMSANETINKRKTEP